VHVANIHDEPEKTAEITENAETHFLGDLGVVCGFF
jgi:hypothetical protein